MVQRASELRRSVRGLKGAALRALAVEKGLDIACLSTRGDDAAAERMGEKSGNADDSKTGILLLVFFA